MNYNSRAYISVPNYILSTSLCPPFGTRLLTFLDISNNAEDDAELREAMRNLSPETKARVREIWEDLK